MLKLWLWLSTLVIKNYVDMFKCKRPSKCCLASQPKLYIRRKDLLSGCMVLISLGQHSCVDAYTKEIKNSMYAYV